MKLIRLLLVEDDLSDQMGFSRFVKKQQLPYDYKIAGSVAEATVILKENQFDIVLTDHALGDGTSFELLEHIPGTTPVIFVTGTGNEGIAVEAMKQGAADYLTKDIDGNYLTLLPLTIESVLKNAALKKELDTYRNNLESLVEERTFELKQEVQGRKKIEQQLIEEKERILVTLRSIGDAVIATDRNGDVIQMNLIAERLTGWTLEEARGLSIKKIFPIVDATTRKPIQNPIDKVIETGATVYLSNHTTLISKNGAEYQISDSAAPIRNDDNAILGMVLVFNNVTEEYLLRTKLLEERLVLRDIIDSSPDLIFLKSPEGVYLRCNKAFEAFFGAAESEIIGKTDFDFVDADIALFFRDKDKITLKKGASHINEERVAYPDGREVYLETLKTPVRDVSGKVSGLLGVSRDITQRKRLEDEIHSQHQLLISSKTRLQEAQKYARIGHWELLADQKTARWSEQMYELFGLSQDVKPGPESLCEIVYESDIPAFVQSVQNSFVTGDEHHVEYRIKRPNDGEERWIECRGKVVKDKDGEFEKISGFIQDITERKLTEEKLLLSSRVFSDTHESIIITDANRQIVDVNPAFCKVTGYSREEAIGQNLRILNSDKQSPEFYADMWQQIDEQGHWQGELWSRKKSGETYAELLTISSLKDDDNNVVNYVYMFSETTELKSHQAQLQRAQKMDAMGKLVGGIAHDYNNMLGVVLGYTDLITMKYSDVDGLQKYVDNIAQAGERGRNLTQRMLAFSKQESSGAEAVSINSVLRAQKELFSKSITARIKLDYKLSEQGGLIWVDSGELEDALLNLTLNAQHAMPDGGALTFSTGTTHLSRAEAQLLGLSENDYLMLTVTDTGCGMDEVVKSKIFDPFFSTKGASGTGLGLSQVYGFMERAGGAISIYSEVDAGTEFILYFPRYQGGKEQVLEQNLTSKTNTNRGDGETILVVDDEPALRVLAREILVLAGYRVFVANDGNAALEVLAANQIDLVLSDVIMPGMDGYQLAEQIQKKHPTIKIQLASGFSDNRHQNSVDNQLHNAMLHKPYASTELLSRIAQLLNKQKDEKS